MTLTTDPNDTQLRQHKSDGQQVAYLVLSEEERAKGFVMPLHKSYTHLKCGSTTSMGLALCETYARKPSFYSGTFCCTCGGHYPLKVDGVWQFEWPDKTPVGSNKEEAEDYLLSNRPCRYCGLKVGDSCDDVCESCDDYNSSMGNAYANHDKMKQTNSTTLDKAIKVLQELDDEKKSDGCGLKPTPVYPLNNPNMELSKFVYAQLEKYKLILGIWESRHLSSKGQDEDAIRAKLIYESIIDELELIKAYL